MQPINSPYMMKMGNDFYESPIKRKFKPLPVMRGGDDMYKKRPPKKEDPISQPRTDKKYNTIKTLFLIAMIVAVFWFLYLASEGQFKSVQDVEQSVDQPIDVQVYNNETTTQNFDVELNATTQVVIEKIVVNCYFGGCETNSSI